MVRLVVAESKRNTFTLFMFHYKGPETFDIEQK